MPDTVLTSCCVEMRLQRPRVQAESTGRPLQSPGHEPILAPAKTTPAKGLRSVQLLDVSFLVLLFI